MIIRFVVDTLNLFYISLLGIEKLTVAVDFASTLLSFTVYIPVGFTITYGTIIARCLNTQYWQLYAITRMGQCVDDLHGPEMWLVTIVTILF